MDQSTPTEWLGISTRGRVVMAVTGTFVGLSLLAVVLRIITRWRHFRQLLADDICCIFSMILGIALFACVAVLSTDGGLGWPVNELPPLQVVKFLKWFYIAEIIYSFVSTFYKLAVLLLYKRIFGSMRTFNRLVWAMMGIAIAWGIGALIPAIFQCTPVHRAWDTTIAGHCIDTPKWILGNGIANLIIDAMILCMPLPLIWRLQLDSKRKLALTGIFLLGAIVCIASIIRITTTLVKINFEDPTYHLYNLTIWSEIEPSFGIICACLPTLRQAFTRAPTPHSKSSQYYTGGPKTPTDTLSKSNTAISLTGWKSARAYAEIEVSTNSGEDARSFRNQQNSSARPLEHDNDGQDTSSRASVSRNRSNEILVTKEIIVQETLEA